MEQWGGAVNAPTIDVASSTSAGAGTSATRVVARASGGTSKTSVGVLDR